MARQPVDLICPACEIVLVSVSMITAARAAATQDFVMCAFCGEISQLIESGDTFTLVEPELKALATFQKFNARTIEVLQHMRVARLRRIQDGQADD